MCDSVLRSMLCDLTLRLQAVKAVLHLTFYGNATHILIVN